MVALLQELPQVFQVTCNDNNALCTFISSLSERWAGSVAAAEALQATISHGRWAASDGKRRHVKQLGRNGYVVAQASSQRPRPLILPPGLAC